MQRRHFLQTLALLSLTGPALAGHELDNRFGKYNGSYVGKAKVIIPDQDDKIIEKIRFDLEERHVNIDFKEGMVRARLDQIYTFGYKTEVMCHHPEKDERYILTTEAGFNQN